eukprot:CAMPEP_0206248846 /NCGR_PEP_ID=MMETSP0047_2-20121206/20590_1 /ASSEMBLY_ACC=CAM_ASM_000192 /TAXON_ID=195065 /ORGANISM="Chroomonas mesostigmatica_cf, Strain CCMP1168" /LENGTH=366 /DNA_ID=CAMNT_0053674523 /DNA_START=51 /DNA_END=1151 /DNA_ORIENTATION=-
MAEKVDEAPEDIILSDQVMSLAFHPSKEVLAASTVDGKVELHGYSLEGNKLLVSSSHHTDSCRALAFSDDGANLYTASADASIGAFDVAAMRPCGQLVNAHEAAVSCVLMLPGNFLASGDDNGVVKIWDLRQQKCCHTLNEHEDFISDMRLASDERTLVCTGGDGYLSVWNRRSGKLYAMSDQMEDEFLSCQIMKHGRKVVCGTQSGTLSIFSWGDWGDVSDRFPGHPESVECMVKVDEETLITCSEDGIIRIVSIQPNKLLGVIGEHEGYPVEHLAVSFDKKYLGSCSHDNTVKFWDVSELYEEGDDGEEGEEGMDEDGDAEMDVEDDSDDDSDDEPRGKHGRKGKKDAAGGRKAPKQRGFYDDM